VRGGNREALSERGVKSAANTVAVHPWQQGSLHALIAVVTLQVSWDLARIIAAPVPLGGHLLSNGEKHLFYVGEK
jgi:hypothetical protein